MPNCGSRLTVPLDLIEHHFECFNLGVVFFADLATALVQPLSRGETPTCLRYLGHQTPWAFQAENTFRLLLEDGSSI
jgi:hypothetical protein